MDELLPRMLFPRLIILLASTFPAFVVAETFRESIIRGYHEECVKVNTQNGMNKVSTKELCDCEAQVFDEHYSTMSIYRVRIQLPSCKLLKSRPSIWVTKVIPSHY